MLTDAILAFLHFLAIFVLITLMAAEAVALRPDLTPATVRRLSLYDLFYFLSAMLALATGLLRLFYGAKGADFYLHNPVFWAKIAAFAAVGLLSIAPTIAILKWRKQAKVDPAFAPPDAEIAKVRKVMLAELLVFALIPMFAAAMARGYGL